MNGRLSRGGLVAGLSNPWGQFWSRLEAFLRPHLDNSLRCRVKDGLAAADELGLQAKPKLITFQTDVQLTSTDAQLLTDHLMAHTTMKRSNLFAANGKVLFFSRLCPERKLLSDSNSNSYRSQVTFSLPQSSEIRASSSSIFRQCALYSRIRMRDMGRCSKNTSRSVGPCPTQVSHLARVTCLYTSSLTLTLLFRPFTVF